jgi:hypothetical protein
MKFDQEHVIEALRDSNVNPDEIDAVMHKLDEIAEEIRREKENTRQRRPKKKLVLLHPVDTATYYVVQSELDADLTQIVPNIQKSIGDYNQRAKKKKVEVTNLCEAIEFIPNKILKDNGVVVKSKTPCEVVEFDGR